MVENPVYILDSYAFLSYLTDETGAEAIEDQIDAAQQKNCRLLLSIINLGEILYITERRGGLQKAKDALALLRQLPIEIIPADEQIVFAAAHIKANYPLSYADAFAAAIALQEHGIILTGDPEFQIVENLVSVEWLERKT